MNPEPKRHDCPYPGMRPFELSESHLFFGRDGQSDELIERLGRTRFVTIIGTSGSGKSSLLRAGLLPALMGGMMGESGSNWRIAILRPGNDPIGHLAGALCQESFLDTDRNFELAIVNAALRRGSRGLVEVVQQRSARADENLLIVVDQFEELFHFRAASEKGSAQEEAAGFVKLLLEAANQPEIPIYVALVLRSDFIGDCSVFWGLPEAINNGLFSIPRMTRDQLREAIFGPLTVSGGSITPQTVNRLLNDVGDNSDQLPILQHALMRTWQSWRASGGPAVDLEHYKAIGTMSESLSQHADEAYNELSDEDQRIAERLFKALTERAADNRDISRPTTIDQLCAIAEATPNEVATVIETFRREDRSFLMPPPGVTLGPDTLIDISHESLIRNWSRLRGWVEEESRSARIYKRLAETATYYQAGQAGLWQGPDLEVALRWREQTKLNETWARRYHPEFATARTFLEESVRAQDARAQDARLLESARHRRRGIKISWLTALLIVFLASLTVLGLIIVYKRL